MMKVLDIYLAGTGGMKPLPDRALTGMWAEHCGSALLIDCGEGMQTALARIGRSLAKLDVLLITHFHADHISGLPGLLLSAGNFGRKDPIRIYCPKGGSDIIGKLCCICPELPFDIEVNELSGGCEFMWGDITVRSFTLKHRIPCFGYSITESRPPVFSADKSDALGVPVRMRKALHSGNTITLDDGRVITPDMVTDGERKPLKVTYITDTVYFPGLADFAENSDLLIAEGMYGDDEYIPKMEQKGHMVMSQSAEIAVKAGVGKLWYTHYSPAMNEPQGYGESMRRIFSGAYMPSDGDHIEIR